VPVLVDIPENDVEGEKGKSSETQCPALTMPPRTAAPADVKGSPSGRVPTCVPRWMRIFIAPDPRIHPQFPRRAWLLLWQPARRRI
jgi:hypothetical protein